MTTESLVIVIIALVVVVGLIIYLRWDDNRN